MKAATEQTYPPLGPEYDDEAQPRMISRLVIYSFLALVLGVVGAIFAESVHYL